MNKVVTALALGSILALSGCSSAIMMVPDKSIPFATGEIDASFEENGNGTFEVSVDHLGPPEKLNPAAKVYVVWIDSKKDEKSTLQNMGVLTVDDSYSGSHKFTTTFKRFDVRVTPEPDASATAPTGRDILRASVSE